MANKKDLAKEIAHTRKNYASSTKYDSNTLLFLTPEQRNEQLNTGRYESHLLSEALIKICKSALLLYQFEQTYVEIIEQLISHGADINFQEPESGNTPLMWAIANMELGVAKHLMDKHGDKINYDLVSPQFSDNTALHIAISKGFFYVDPTIQTQFNCGEIAKQLIQCGARLNAKNACGFTPLDIAILKRDTAFLRMFSKEMGPIQHVIHKKFTYEQAKMLISYMFPAHGIFPSQEEWRGNTLSKYAYVSTKDVSFFSVERSITTVSAIADNNQFFCR